VLYDWCVAMGPLKETLILTKENASEFIKNMFMPSKEYLRGLEEIHKKFDGIKITDTERGFTADCDINLEELPLDKYKCLVAFSFETPDGHTGYGNKMTLCRKLDENWIVHFKEELRKEMAFKNVVIFNIIKFDGGL